MDKWISLAEQLGMSAAILDVRLLRPVQMVRNACVADTCGAYGKNWTCPPYCGTLEQCDEKIHSYSRGILLQTVGILDKIIDTKGYARVEKAHLAQFAVFCDALRREYPEALCLGSGGCRICEQCAWPEPCRFPQRACASMEGYGLFVTQVCRDHGVTYYHGQKTITYCSCVLF